MKVGLNDFFGKLSSTQITIILSLLLVGSCNEAKQDPAPPNSSTGTTSNLTSAFGTWKKTDANTYIQIDKGGAQICVPDQTTTSQMCIWLDENTLSCDLLGTKGVNFDVEIAGATIKLIPVTFKDTHTTAIYAKTANAFPCTAPSAASNSASAIWVRKYVNTAGANVITTIYAGTINGQKNRVIMCEVGGTTPGLFMGTFQPPNRIAWDTKYNLPGYQMNVDGNKMQILILTNGGQSTTGQYERASIWPAGSCPATFNNGELETPYGKKVQFFAYTPSVSGTSPFTYAISYNGKIIGGATPKTVYPFKDTYFTQFELDQFGNYGSVPPTGYRFDIVFPAPEYEFTGKKVTKTLGFSASELELFENYIEIIGNGSLKVWKRWEVEEKKGISTTPSGLTVTSTVNEITKGKFVSITNNYSSKINFSAGELWRWQVRFITSTGDTLGNPNGGGYYHNKGDFGFAFKDKFSPSTYYSEPTFLNPQITTWAPADKIIVRGSLFNNMTGQERFTPWISFKIKDPTDLFYSDYTYTDTRDGNQYRVRRLGNVDVMMDPMKYKGLAIKDLFLTGFDGSGNVLYQNTVHTWGFVSDPKNSVCPTGWRILNPAQYMFNFERLPIKTVDVIKSVGLRHTGIQFNYELAKYESAITWTIEQDYSSGNSPNPYRSRIYDNGSYGLAVETLKKDFTTNGTSPKYYYVTCNCFKSN